MWPKNARPRAKTSAVRYFPGAGLGAPAAGPDGVLADAAGDALAAPAGVGALGSRSGGQGNSELFPVARSTKTKRVARGLAGTDTRMRAIA